MRPVVIALITSSIPFGVMYLYMLIKIELKRKKRENERYYQTYNNNNNSYIRYNFSLKYEHLYPNTFMTNK